jgi:enterochelin esterase-like enzyme
LKSPWLTGVILALVLGACSPGPVSGDVLPDVSPSKEATTGITISPGSEQNTPQPTQKGILEPSITPSQTPNPCKEVQGSSEPFSITRRDQELTGRIYTPPCYGDDPDQRYPVLVLLHGTTASDEQWEDLGVFTLVDELITSGSIPPVIIVLPKERSWIPLPDNPFGDQLIKDLIPWLDGEYQTRASREYRAIGGLSRGGNWAVRLGFLHWGLFGSVGAHSTPLFRGDQERIPGWYEAIPDSKIPRVYIDIGRDDKNLPDTTEFAEQLLTLEIPHSWHLFPGTHEDFYWQDHLREYLLWYSSGWGGD